MARSIEQQLRQIDQMARAHYPEDDAKCNAYKVSLLEQRLREYHYRFQGLPVREMKA